MYYNVFGEKVSGARFREMVNAAKNRRELIAAGLTGRRDLLKLGLLTAAGTLAPIRGLSAQTLSPTPTQNPTGSNNVCVPTNQPASPPTTPFVEPLPIMPTAQTVRKLNPAPSLCPNTQAGEVRAACHQAPPLGFPFPPPRLYQFTQHPITVIHSPQLPQQTVWGFDDGTHATSPGPTYAANYGIAQLTRNINNLPSQNGGFGLNSATTHLHNGHTPSESDGNPCDFYGNGHFCDQYYPNVLAGFNSDHKPSGDINESMSTLWYHDHRVDFTAQNTYKGLVGFYLLFNQFDTGDEGTGFHLPSFPQFDIPLAFADKVYDPTTGLLAFDLFNLDGIIGDKFLVNGKIQPFLRVARRKYRFRILNGSSARVYQLFLSPERTPSFVAIGTDSHLLEHPVSVQSFRLAPAERVEVVVDFRNYSLNQEIFLVNRLDQTDGRKPNGLVSPGTPLLKFIVDREVTTDPSRVPATLLPVTEGPSQLLSRVKVQRTFEFNRSDGAWQINGEFFDENRVNARPRVGEPEIWLLKSGGGWVHPVHIHLSDFFILSRDGKTPPPLEQGRKETVLIGADVGDVKILIKFDDPREVQTPHTPLRYVFHCHNIEHEDMRMMGQFAVQT